MTDVQYFVEKLGGVSIWRFLDDQWIVSVDLDDAEYEVDLDEKFQTPGQALDAAIKWSKSRGLDLAWMSRRFDLVRHSSTRNP